MKNNSKHPTSNPNTIWTLSRGLWLSASLGLLVACSTAAPLAPPSPGGTSLDASQRPSPSASPSALPSADPSAIATPAPSGTPAPSALPTLSPSSGPQPTATPSPNNLQPAITDYRQNFFINYGVNPFVEAATDPLSTFAADVDTGSYSLTRAYLNQGLLPPEAAVRTEEFINSFNYQYNQPLNGTFAIHTDLAPSYFGDPSSKLLRVGIQGKEVLDHNRKQAILTVVIDVSGSMNRENRLELAKASLKLLLSQLRPSDQVGVVVYGTEARVLIGHTPVSSRALIEGALEQLRPEGSTNAEAGLSLAYTEAERALRLGAINRVILVSDGVANVGAKGPEEILTRIKGATSKGITLTTLGFGLQGFNDVLMEQLANQGDGNYAYIDSLEQARKLLVEQLTSTLQVIAKDVKIQLEFNPELVDQYRLLGYENRDVADDDFRNDAVDAGEVGSNHAVTALYEVRFKPEARPGRVGTLRIRYQDAEDQMTKELAEEINSSNLVAFSNASPSFKLATAVAEFAEVLRGSVFAEGSKLSNVLSLAREAQQKNPDPQLAELVSVLEKAQNLYQPGEASSVTSLVNQSQNPKQLPQWQQFLLKQLGGQSGQ